MTAEVRRAAGPDEVAAALALRAAVFIDEQGVPLEEELDGRDGEALQLVAVDADGTVVGTCRLLAEGTVMKLGRLAVAPAARRSGIALRLLRLADAEARAAGAEATVLAAQVYALPLYERAGYAARGDVFLDAGIEHVRMLRRHA